MSRNELAWTQVHQRWSSLTQTIQKSEESRQAEHLKKQNKALAKQPAKAGKSVVVPGLQVPPEVCFFFLGVVFKTESRMLFKKLAEWNHFSGFICAAAGVSAGRTMKGIFIIFFIKVLFWFLMNSTNSRTITQNGVDSQSG